MVPSNAISTHVFHDKDSPPADLRAEIFDEQFTTTAHVLEKRIIVQSFSFTLQRELLTGRVKLKQNFQSHIHATWNA